MPRAATLRDAILSDAAVAPVHLDVEGDAAPLLDAENSPRSLMRVCGRTTAVDPRIDQAWQATWGGDATGPYRVVRAAEVAAHYSGVTGSAAVDAIKKQLTCQQYADTGGLTVTVVDRLSSVTAPGTNEQFGFCATSAGTLFECTLLLSRGAVAAAVTVNGMTESGTEKAIRTLSPALAEAIVAAATGQRVHATGSPPAATTPTLAPVVGRTWTQIEAQQHLIAMALSFDPGFEPRQILHLLTDGGIPPADRVSGVHEYADEYKGHLQVFAENLAAGRWPTAVQARMAALAHAARGDASAYAYLERAADVTQVRARFAAAQVKESQTEARLRDARAALGLHK